MKRGKVVRPARPNLKLLKSIMVLMEEGTRNTVQLKMELQQLRKNLLTIILPETRVQVLFFTERQHNQVILLNHIKVSQLNHV